MRGRTKNPKNLRTSYMEASIYDIRTEGGGGKKSKKFADVIYGSPPIILCSGDARYSYGVIFHQGHTTYFSEVCRRMDGDGVSSLPSLGEQNHTNVPTRLLFKTYRIRRETAVEMASCPLAQNTLFMDIRSRGCLPCLSIICLKSPGELET